MQLGRNSYCTSRSLHCASTWDFCGLTSTDGELQESYLGLSAKEPPLVMISCGVIRIDMVMRPIRSIVMDS